MYGRKAQNRIVGLCSGRGADQSIEVNQFRMAKSRKSKFANLYGRRSIPCRSTSRVSAGTWKRGAVRRCVAMSRISSREDLWRASLTLQQPAGLRRSQQSDFLSRSRTRGRRSNNLLNSTVSSCFSPRNQLSGITATISSIKLQSSAISLSIQWSKLRTTGLTP